MSAGRLMAAIDRALQKPIGQLLQNLDSLVQIRRPLVTRDADNSERVTGWRDIANGDSVAAAVVVEESTEPSDVGEDAPVRRGVMLVSGVCAPRVDDGVRVLEGRYARQTFRIMTARPSGAIVWRCEIRATTETFD